MTPLKLSDQIWNQLLETIRKHPNTYVGDEAACRRFVEAVLWMVRSGAQWRLLPAAYGNWNSIYKRFARWQEAGVWHQLHMLLLAELRSAGRLDFSRASLDAASVPSPRGARTLGPTPRTGGNSAANVTSSRTARASR